MSDPSVPDERVDPESFNLACFRLVQALDELDFCVPEAGPLARRLLRAVGRVVIDTAGPGADPAGWSNTEAMVVLWVDEALREQGYEVRPRPGAGRRELQDLREPARDWS
jgi:hypothetical protein